MPHCFGNIVNSGSSVVVAKVVDDGGRVVERMEAGNSCCLNKTRRHVDYLTFAEQTSVFNLHFLCMFVCLQVIIIGE